MMKRLLLSVIVIASFTVGFDATAAAPAIEIETPSGGFTTSRVVKITGWIRGVGQAMLVVNGSERPLQVSGDMQSRRSFAATILIPPGQNTIVVSGKTKKGKLLRDSVSFFARVPRLDLSVVLSWDTDGTDLDMHVSDPNGEECYYGHKQTEAGGRLDVDDTDGYGPEVFTLANALEGEYTVKVKYYSSNGHAQSLAVVDVLMYEGTDAERRERFEIMLTRTNETYVVGRFKLKAAGGGIQP